MNIFGVGGPELAVILVIMLVFAGPKRMIHWSYILGQYLAKFRTMWAQTVDLVQKEFDDAGVDIKLPKEPPTRKNINKSISDALQPMTKPLQDSVDELKKDVEGVKAISDDFNKQTAEISEDLKEQTSNTPKPHNSKKITQPVNVLNNKPKEDSTTETSTVPEPQTEDNTNPSLGTWSASSADK